MHFHFHHHHHGGRGGGGPTLPTLPVPDESSMELVLLEPDKLQFRREGSTLQAQQEGDGEWQDVILVRLFPLTDHGGWVSLLDKEGREIGVLRDLASLSEGSKELVADELYRRYLVPRIERVVSCHAKFDMMEWTMDTDRGRVTFLTRNLREQLQQPTSRRLSIIDVEGNRYDIVDMDELDAFSRHKLDEQL